MARIIGIGTANPPFRYTQNEIWRAYLDTMPMSTEAQQLLGRLFQNESIAYRYLGLEKLSDAARTSQDELIARFERHAVPAATGAARRALEVAGVSSRQVDALVVNTCTGYLCPGLTSYLTESLGLRSDVWPFDLMGMGCGGALPNLETANNFLRAHSGATALCVAAEICSATLFFDESPDILVSNAIFGDGAAAVVLSDAANGAGIRLVDLAGGLFPESRQALHYRWENSRLRNVLSRRVPVLGARYAAQVIDGLLARHGLAHGDIGHWIVHPGGEKVLEAFERAIPLPVGALDSARAILREYGNMSSASVLFVLERVMRVASPARGELGVMCSFGAGFSAYAALLEFA